MWATVGCSKRDIAVDKGVSKFIVKGVLNLPKGCSLTLRLMTLVQHTAKHARRDHSLIAGTCMTLPSTEMGHYAKNG